LIIAVHATDEPDAGRIQTITSCEIVWQRHLGNQRLHISTRIKFRSRRIAAGAEDAELSQWTRRADRSYGVAVHVNCRVAGNCVSVLHPGVIPEDALARLRRQDRTCDILARRDTVALEQEKEKCFVLDNRSTEPESELIAVLVILLTAFEVIAPGVGIKRRISVRPKRGTAELVGSRARHQLHLAGAASHLGIRWRDNDANFFDQVGSHIGHRTCTGVVPAISDDDSV
jgi:hypothetical protein